MSNKNIDMFKKSPVHHKYSLYGALEQAGDQLSIDTAPLVPLAQKVFHQGGLLGVHRNKHSVVYAIENIPTDGVFELACLTKPFTSALAATLVKNKAVSWDMPISALGGPFRRLPPTLSLQTLANHTSSLPAHPARTPLTSMLSLHDPYGSLSPHQVIASAARWAKKTPVNPPQWAYSNLGYGVLALALAYAEGSSLSAQGFAKALAEYVLQPMDLTDIDWQTERRRLVTPKGLLGKTEVTSFAHLAGAGGLLGTAEALLKFAELHRTGKFKYWQKPQWYKGLEAPAGGMAPGWFHTNRVYWHDGISRGTRTAMGFSSYTDISVVLLARGKASPFAQKHAIAELLLKLLTKRRWERKSVSA